MILIFECCSHQFLIVVCMLTLIMFADMHFTQLPLYFVMASHM